MIRLSNGGQEEKAGSSLHNLNAFKKWKDGVKLPNHLRVSESYNCIYFAFAKPEDWTYDRECYSRVTPISLYLEERKFSEELSLALKYYQELIKKLEERHKSPVKAEPMNQMICPPAGSHEQMEMLEKSDYGQYSKRSKWGLYQGSHED